MIAAIYARESTEQNVPDAKRVTRQVDLARAFAVARGWTVEAAHVYADDGISGAEFADRPGLARLMAAAKARAVAVLVTMDQDRIGRDQRWTQATLHDLIEAGVRVYYYATGEELRLDTPVHEFMSAAKNFGNQWYRHQVRAKTREAMRAKAQHGHVAGGRVYGYRNVRENSHVARVVHEPEAAIVRRLFTECAAGRGFTRIAKGLTAAGVPSPHPGRGWAATAVREMIFRPLYRGQIVYGKTRWQDKGGTKIKVDVPEAEWIRVDAPDLRIVDETLWQAAHRRLDRTRAIYLRQTNGKLWGRPEAGLEAKYLLSGFVVCATCGGAMHATKRTSLRGAPQLYYVCRTHRVRGDRLCANYWSAPMADLDTDVCATLARDVLTPARVERTIRRAIELHAASPDTVAERHQALTRELRRLEQEIGRLTGAIATGAPLPSLLEALHQRERTRAELQAQLEHLNGLTRAATRWEGGGLAEELAARMAEWQEVLHRPVGAGAAGAAEAVRGPVAAHARGAPRRTVLRLDRSGVLRPAASGFHRCTRYGAPGVTRTPGTQFRNRIGPHSGRGVATRPVTSASVCSHLLHPFGTLRAPGSTRRVPLTDGWGWEEAPRGVG
jgi:DNA invertase Pin-like site-specific DNA recombinase